jgi:hypothetical protein
VDVDVDVVVDVVMISGDIGRCVGGIEAERLELGILLKKNVFI